MKTLLKCAFAATVGFLLAGCGDDVGKVSLGLLPPKM